MKILFATLPFDGHFNPLTGIAMHLQVVGHEVRWYAGPSYAAKLSRLGIHHFPFKRAILMWMALIVGFILVAPKTSVSGMPVPVISGSILY
jgi:hypothetical protein